MAEARWHVSSAVVNVATGAMGDITEKVSALPGVEVHGRDETRIVVTIEGTSTGQLGDRLTEINLMPGVLAANMVFEHAEDAEGAS